MNPDELINALPSKYHTLGLLALAWIPFLLRGCHALANGRGLFGAISGVLWGTNTPKPEDPGAARSMGKVLTFLAVGFLTFGSLGALTTGCASSIERNTFTAATVTQSAIDTAYATWLDDFVTRAGPFIVVDHPGHRAIDWTKCPGLLAEANTVDAALETWKASVGVAVNGLLAVKDITQGAQATPAQIADAQTHLAASAAQLLIALKTK
jgi:hypothetical protein